MLTSSSYAAETASFLKVGVGARPLGMGGAYTAIANDINAMTWNPAGLGGLSKRELGIMDAELALGTHLGFAGYAQPTKYGTIGAGVLHLSQSGLTSRDESGRQTGGYSAADTAVNLSYGYKLAEGTRLGGNAKFISSNIDANSAQTFAFDLGAMRDLNLRGPGVPMVGFAIQNLGPGMKFGDQREDLPLALAGGLGYRLPAGVTLAADYRYRPNLRQSEVSFGTEYGLFSNFTLRGGYGTGQNGGTAVTSGASSAFNGVAMGFGLKFRDYSLDYALSPFGQLGNVQRFSLGARW